MDWKSDFRRLGKNELVGLCHQAGYRTAHKGMDTEELIGLLEGNIQDEDPFDPLRQVIMTYIKDHQGEITLSCDGNCYRHSWAKVLQCYNIVAKKDLP